MSFIKSLFGGSKEPKKESVQQAPTSKPTPPPAPAPKAEPKPEAPALTVSEDAVLTQQTVKTKPEVLKLIADKMLELGYVSADYTKALSDREEKVSTFLINGVAIPHGTVEAKHLVSKTGLVIVQIPEGVTWSGKGEVVKLAVGIAAAGQEHLQILQQLTTVVMDEALSQKLCETATAAEIIEALGQKKIEEAQQATDLDVKKSATIVDAAGMHARPASKISETASEFSGTEVRLRNGNRMANAKSMANLLTMGAITGDEIVVSAHGKDAEAAVNLLVDMINAGLDTEADGEDNSNYNPLESLPALEDPHGRLMKQGAAASPGIAMATVHILTEDEAPEETNISDVPAELKILQGALTKAATQLDSLHAEMMETAPNEAAIFKAQKQLLTDETITNVVKNTIKKGKGAAWSYFTVIEANANELLAVEDERIKARAADMMDVCTRVVNIIQGKADGGGYPEHHDFILLAKELTPSQTALLSSLPVRAICTEIGGPNSHMAILARALGIPAIVGAGEGLTKEVREEEIVIVDPQGPAFIAGPDSETMQKAKDAIASWARIQELENSQKHEKAVTTDDHEVEVVCNIASPKDTPGVLENGGEGVGLLRTEFLFEASSVEPTVEEQANALKEIVGVLESRQLVVRTADIGGDKPVSWLSMPAEDNPFLGVRGIRLSFRNKDMFRNQIEAIYRVAMWQEEQNIKSGIHIMFPMIAKVSEWRKARDFAEKIRLELNAPKLPMGIMVEIPSAALQADNLAKEVDFFSVGSNDLTQYTLAMDRLHPELAAEADSYNPALLRLIDMTVRAADVHGKWVGVCGNMAADPDLASILVGLGVKELSISPADVPAVKLLIRSVSYAKLRAKAQKAIKLENSEDIRALYKDRSDLV